MKRTFLILMPLIFLAGTLPFLPSAPQHPKLIVSPETWEMGKVAGGKIYTQMFWLCNQGKETLKISNIRTSCGCTTTRLSTTEISSASCTSFEATFKSGSFKGKVKKKIYIHSNDPEKEVTLIKITADLQ